ncbi:hypothetical protein [Mycobacteroides abscessus]|nr:hypothetical protein [Mycobacteroides abscessus]
MANDQPVRVDHDEVQEWTRRSDMIHDRYNDVMAKLDEAVNETVAEASKYTENGAPSPIYANTIAKTKEAVGHAKAQITKHQQNMKKDSQTTLKYSEAAKEEAAESGARIAGTETRFAI